MMSNKESDQQNSEWNVATPGPSVTHPSDSVPVPVTSVASRLASREAYKLEFDKLFEEFPCLALKSDWDQSTTTTGTPPEECSGMNPPNLPSTSTATRLTSREEYALVFDKLFPSVKTDSENSDSQESGERVQRNSSDEWLKMNPGNWVPDIQILGSAPRSVSISVMNSRRSEESPGFFPASEQQQNYGTTMWNLIQPGSPSFPPQNHQNRRAFSRGQTLLNSGGFRQRFPNF